MYKNRNQAKCHLIKLEENYGSLYIKALGGGEIVFLKLHEIEKKRKIERKYYLITLIAKEMEILCKAFRSKVKVFSTLQSEKYF